ncbi:MAG: hypothetical protein CYPHOPRED_005631 [Cyphobasidiales sp. Tagirdzhanova-0007]|nr:MAG: hypothetical protein CYPHOPRED_005631 [Cyphobasidiales sp. Tagirdzhanova-0007]
MADDESTEGASPFEQLLYASKNDSVELAATSLRNPKLGQDVNKADGMGYTGDSALCGKGPFTRCIREHEATDVDLQDKMDGNTPLHHAVRLSHPEARKWVVRTLLEAGADPHIANKHRERAVDLLPPKDELQEDFKRAEAESAIESRDIVHDDSDVDGEEGGDSGEDLA